MSVLVCACQPQSRRVQCKGRAAQQGLGSRCSKVMSHGKRCCLTIRSTGHFAACGCWASFHSRPTPACRKMPVSSNVRPRNSRVRWFICSNKRHLFAKNQNLISSLQLAPWVNSQSAKSRRQQALAHLRAFTFGSWRRTRVAPACLCQQG